MIDTQERLSEAMATREQDQGEQCSQGGSTKGKGGDEGEASGASIKLSRQQSRYGAR